MGYRLNRHDAPVFMAGPKPMLTEFGIHRRLESGVVSLTKRQFKILAVKAFANFGCALGD